MNTCASCRHWMKPSERTNYYSPVSVDMKYYEDPVQPDELAKQDALRDAADMALGVCRGIPFYPSVQELPTPAAAIIDGSEYYAELFTSAEFGCVLHVLAEETP